MADRQTRGWNQDEDRYWRENYSSRSYTDEERNYEDYQPGYRFGTEAANRHSGRQWTEAEPELRKDWDRYEHRGDKSSTWEDIKHAAKDAWDRVTGDDSSHGSRGDATRRTTETGGNRHNV